MFATRPVRKEKMLPAWCVCVDLFVLCIMCVCVCACVCLGVLWWCCVCHTACEEGEDAACMVRACVWLCVLCMRVCTCVWVCVGLARTVYIHRIHMDRIYGGFSAKNTVYTPYTHGPGQP